MIGISWLGRQLGGVLARFLAQPTHVHAANPVVSSARLLACLQAGDVLLVDGHSRFSTAVKYLTQSTWSHAALFLGDELTALGGNPAHQFIEADVVAGVRSVGIEEFAGKHTRICRPVGLDANARRQLASAAFAHIGHQYDLKNIFDLARYLLPTPPVPQRFRRRLLALGSGDPTRAICSGLIAEAFQSIHYPILPETSIRSADRPDCPDCVEAILSIRHHSLFAPRDFDVSPYFQVIKPTLASGFDYKAIRWQTEGAV
ncbi:MAG: lipo-like protein [Lysobacterales bacterium CG02_land_8_20_14_3_00_62_12]|nr:MAG: lipo-like protein [Xanthomonadales bacterium CG02_land_8_20_14_3_00_62_12]